jgi:hypothetical protein
MRTERGTTERAGAKNGRKIALNRGLRAIVALVFVATGCGSAVSTVLAGKVAGDVVEDARQAANELLGQAERSGSALIARSANEMSVLAANATQMLGSELGTNVEKLSTEHRLLLEQLDQTRRTAESMKAGAFDVKDSTVLDLQRLLGDSVIGAEYSFLVQRVEGITQLRKPGGEYVISVTGIGFGTDSDRLTSKITSVKVDGKPVRFRETKARAWLSHIAIPQPLVEPLFKEHALEVVPVTIDVAVDRKNRIWGSKATQHQVPLYVTLMPRAAGQITVSYGGPRKDWVVVANQQYSYTTPDHHQRGDIRKFAYQDSRVIEADKRFVGPFTYTHQGEGCPWTEVSSLGTLENGRRLNLAVQVWGSPCTHFYGAAVEEYKVVGEYHNAKSYDLQYGQNLVVELPPDATFWRVQGITSMLQDVDLVNKGSDSTLVFKDLIDSGNVRRVVYQVVLPDGV